MPVWSVWQYFKSNGLLTNKYGKTNPKDRHKGTVKFIIVFKKSVKDISTSCKTVNTYCLSVENAFADIFNQK